MLNNRKISEITEIVVATCNLEDLLMAIYINHQRYSPADLVINPDILPITRETILKHTISHENGFKTIGGKILVEIDFRSWPVLDASKFNHNHATFTLPNIASDNPTKVIRKEKTLQGILDQLNAGIININTPPTTKEVIEYTWQNYAFFNKENPSSDEIGNPSDTLEEALALLKPKFQNDTGTTFNSLDLGSGSGRDTVAMLKAGWKVCAQDSQKEALDKLKKNALSIVAYSAGNLHVIKESFENLYLKKICENNKVYLVNASYSLPYAGTHCDRIIGDIKEILQPGGFFAGHFFRNTDPLAGAIGVKTHAEREIENLFLEKEFERVVWKPNIFYHFPRVDGTDKEWHEFHIVVRKAGFS